MIALTAHAIAGYRERVMRAGMDDYLTKPLRREELDATLRRFLRRPGDAPSQPAVAV